MVTPICVVRADLRGYRRSLRLFGSILLCQSKLFFINIQFTLLAKKFVCVLDNIQQVNIKKTLLLHMLTYVQNARTVLFLK